MFQTCFSMVEVRTGSNHVWCLSTMIWFVSFNDHVQPCLNMFWSLLKHVYHVLGTCTNMFETRLNMFWQWKFQQYEATAGVPSKATAAVPSKGAAGVPSKAAAGVPSKAAQEYPAGLQQEYAGELICMVNWGSAADPQQTAFSCLQQTRCRSTADLLHSPQQAYVFCKGLLTKGLLPNMATISWQIQWPC